MTVSEKEPSLYENIHYIYSRDQQQVLSSRLYSKEFNSRNIISYLEKDSVPALYGVCKYAIGEKYVAWELKKDDNLYFGVVTAGLEESEFNEWFMHLLLANLALFKMSSELEAVNQLEDLVSEAFEVKLKHTTMQDQWTAGGRDFFKQTVSNFLCRNQPIEAVLPAFPCKSSNKDKVVSWKPDKGEELALMKLIEFSQYVQLIYPPGMVIWIVSDGHVFSDCINVDDKDVDRYSEELQALYRKHKPETYNCIKFCSLKDIFKSKYLGDIQKYMDKFQVEYHLATAIDAETEIYRKLLIKCCDVDSHKLYEDIRTPNHPRLKLFRGFMKFMENDLLNTEKAQNLSKKKYKKLISQIAFEMIKRNDAYSNLVELFFPFHLRLSIHAHNNSGPKFAVRLLPKDNCTSVEQLSIALKDVCMDDLLHIPTPWHSAVLKLEDSNTYVVGRSATLRQLACVDSWDAEQRCFRLNFLA